MVAITLPPRPTAALTGAVLILLSACGFNAVPNLEERAKSAWGEVMTQSQRRAAVVPSLVETVRRSAGREREVLTEVTQSLAMAGQIEVDAATTTDPERFRAFQEAQDRLSTALIHLLATVERYPDLRTNSAFDALRSQLEQVENRLAVARRDYREAARAYNAQIRAIPGRWIVAFRHPGAKPMETFTPLVDS